MMPLRRISVAVALLCGLALFAPLGPGVQAVPLSRPEAGFYADIGHPDLQTFDALNASALAKPYIDGAAIVVQWGEIEPRPGVYDWTILDRWAVPTVRLHKKLSLGVIAGLFAPAWLYGPGYDVPKNVFRFNRSGSDAHPGCDDAFTQPSFWSGTYVREYGTMMKALAEHLRVMQAPDVPRGSAYAALYLVKLSGINNTTEELRIDASAPDDGPCRQSDAAAIWAKAGLTPRRVEAAFATLERETAAAFPDKMPALAIIHRRAFPALDDDGRPTAEAVPDAITTAILEALVAKRSSHVLIQWDALYQRASLKELTAAYNAGAHIGWQLNGFLGPRAGSGCIYPGFKIEPCKNASDFASIFTNGIDQGGDYFEIQVGSIANPAWTPAFVSSHERLFKRYPLDISAP